MATAESEAATLEDDDEELSDEDGQGSSEDEGDYSDDDAAAEAAESGGEEEQEDEESDDLEDFKDYKKGGYHPVSVGESFNNGRYGVLSKLGWGHFSTVWLAWDREKACAVTLKVQKSAQRYSEAARDEVELLRTVAASKGVAHRCLVLLTDSFQHRGPHGSHHVMTFEVLGPTLLSLIKQTEYQGLALPVVRRMASSILFACAHLHDTLSIIHTDLKPENILCEYTPDQLHALVEVAKADAAAAIDAKVAAAAAEAEAAGAAGEAAAAGAANACDAGGKRSSKKPSTAVNGATGAAASTGAPRGASHASHEPRLKMQKPPFALDSPQMRFKVVDLGNSCWRDRHFTSDIQTRQYAYLPRSPSLSHLLWPSVAFCSLRSLPPCPPALLTATHAPRGRYRCPEVICGSGYDTSADMWSVACVLFEV